MSSSQAQPLVQQQPPPLAGSGPGMRSSQPAAFSAQVASGRLVPRKDHLLAQLPTQSSSLHAPHQAYRQQQALSQGGRPLDSQEYSAQSKNGALAQNNTQSAVKASVRLSGNLGAASNSSSANQLRQYNKASDMIIMHQGGVQSAQPHQLDGRPKNSYFKTDKVAASALVSTGHAGAKAQNLSHVNIQNTNLSLGAGAAVNNQALTASASGAGARHYFAGQQPQTATYLPAHLDPARSYHNPEDEASMAVTPAHARPQIASPALVSASCDDRALLIRPGHQLAGHDRQSRTATAGSFASKKKEGVPGGYGVLENAFIQQKLHSGHHDAEEPSAKPGQRTPATISEYPRQAKQPRSGGASVAESRIQLKVPQGQNFPQMQGKSSLAKPGQPQSLNHQ